MTPDQWARENRVYSETTGWPGPRKPELTPYVIEPMRAVASGTTKLVVAVFAAQAGKTDGGLDLIGHRLDTRPAPILYVGPSKEFCTDQFEPRLMTLLDEAPSLAAKVVRGRNMKKTLKTISGVRLRLAHAGSSTALKSDPAALAIVDEIDEMLANVRGQGDPLGLITARGYTYAEFCAYVASTPSIGNIRSEIDKKSGLEFWKVAEPVDIESAIWKLFQQGTMYHWAWPCPHCNEYFIPRMHHLKWKDGATPAEAAKHAWLECPHCGCDIENDAKAGMNERGVYVAPGQSISKSGTVKGAPPESDTLSYWTSGLCSPFVTWGQRASEYLAAKKSGEEDKIQTAVNAGFGECYSMGMTGETLELDQVMKCKAPYRLGQIPTEVMRITAGVDVQKRSLYFVIRGWGSGGSSWLLDHGQLHGPTWEQGIWDELYTQLNRDFDGLSVERALIDSGYRPERLDRGDENAIYNFARAYPWLVWPTKGHDKQPTPIKASQIEVTEDGKKLEGGMTLYHLDTDFFKMLVHSRINLEIDRPGRFHIPLDIEEAYCNHLISENRAINPDTMKVKWVPRHRMNHYLDAEALAAAGGYALRVQTIPPGMHRAPPPKKRDSEDGQPVSSSSLADRFAKLSQGINSNVEHAE